MRRVCSFFLLSLLAPLSFAQVPDLNGFWNAQLVPAPEGQALLDKLPPDAVFINDAGAGELGEGEYSGLQLSEAAQKEIENYDFASELSREFACNAPSVAFYMQAPFPMEIHQADKLIVMKMEYYDQVRLIHLDGRDPPPADVPHSKSGHSVGHWEGDELVVDTTHIASGSFMNNGFNHSDNIRLTERFKLSADGQTLFLTQVTEDPEVFTGKAARYMSWRKGEGYVYPYECDPNFAGE
ncbi:MAG: hypothetical protein SV422_14810 [Pseudomonadota bacterium]|nr:hypothetical protein [Pseudomonadota bacterium]